MKCERLGDAGFVCTGDIIALSICRCVRNALADSVRGWYYDGKTPGEIADEILAMGGHDPNVSHPVGACPCRYCMTDETAALLIEIGSG